MELILAAHRLNFHRDVSAHRSDRKRIGGEKEWSFWFATAAELYLIVGARK